MKISFKIQSFAFLFLLISETSQIIAQTTLYYSTTGGDFRTLSNWNDQEDGNGNAPTSIDSEDVFIIQNGHSISVDQNTTVMSVGVFNGTITIPNAITLTLSNSTLNGLYLAGSGNAVIDVGGTVNINNSMESGLYVSAGATLTINGSVSVTDVGSGDSYDDGATLLGNTEISGTLNITNTIGAMGIYLDDGADCTIKSTGSVSITGQGNDDDGIYINHANSDLVIEDGGSLTINNVKDDGIETKGTVNNSGTININTPAEIGVYVRTNGTYLNQSTGVLNIDSPSENALDASSTSNIITNNGTIQVTNPSINYLGIATLINSGTLKGTGSIPVTNLTLNAGSIIAPGSSPGKITFNGNIDLSNVILDLELEGTGAPGTNYDQVAINGQVTFNSTTVRIRNANGFTPSVGNSFSIMAFSSKVGDPTYDHALCCSWTEAVNENLGITITADALLPIEWVNFRAYPEVESNFLEWSVIQDIQSDHFLVEHSNNGSDFETIGNVSANGIHAKLEHYTFTHKAPNTGWNYYRIIHIDQNSQVDYSKTLSVWRQGRTSNSIDIYPNPTSDRIHFSSTISGDYQIFNDLGQLILQGIFAENQSLNVSNLKGGRYILKFVDKENTLQTMVFIKT